jgi:glycosyltransferase involved in cell wall biosynthesis
LRAHSLLTRELPNTRLLLAGQGLEEEAVRALAEELHVAERTSFLGHVSDVSGLLKASDILILASHCEGFGRCLVEGMVARLPVIGSDVVGIRDVISHERTGLLCSAGDVTAHYQALKRLATDPALRVRLGAQARTEAMENFDESVPAARVIDVYRTLLDSKLDPSSGSVAGGGRREVVVRP